MGIGPSNSSSGSGLNNLEKGKAKSIERITKRSEAGDSVSSGNKLRYLRSQNNDDMESIDEEDVRSLHDEDTRSIESPHSKKIGDSSYFPDANMLAKSCYIFARTFAKDVKLEAPIIAISISPKESVLKLKEKIASHVIKPENIQVSDIILTFPSLGETSGVRTILDDQVDINESDLCKVSVGWRLVNVWIRKNPPEMERQVVTLKTGLGLTLELHVYPDESIRSFQRTIWDEEGTPEHEQVLRLDDQDEPLSDFSKSLVDAGFKPFCVVRLIRTKNILPSRVTALYDPSLDLSSLIEAPLKQEWFHNAGKLRILSEFALLQQKGTSTTNRRMTTTSRSLSLMDVASSSSSNSNTSTMTTTSLTNNHENKKSRRVTLKSFSMWRKDSAQQSSNDTLDHDSQDGGGRDRTISVSSSNLKGDSLVSVLGPQKIPPSTEFNLDIYAFDANLKVLMPEYAFHERVSSNNSIRPIGLGPFLADGPIRVTLELPKSVLQLQSNDNVADLSWKGTGIQGASFHIRCLPRARKGRHICKAIVEVYGEARCILLFTIDVDPSVLNQPGLWLPVELDSSITFLPPPVLATGMDNQISSTLDDVDIYISYRKYSHYMEASKLKKYLEDNFGYRVMLTSVSAVNHTSAKGLSLSTKSKSRSNLNKTYSANSFGSSNDDNESLSGFSDAGDNNKVPSSDRVNSSPASHFLQRKASSSSIKHHGQLPSRNRIKSDSSSVRSTGSASMAQNKNHNISSLPDWVSKKLSRAPVFIAFLSGKAQGDAVPRQVGKLTSFGYAKQCMKDGVFDTVLFELTQALNQVEVSPGWTAKKSVLIVRSSDVDLKKEFTNLPVLFQKLESAPICGPGISPPKQTKDGAINTESMDSDIRETCHVIHSMIQEHANSAWKSQDDLKRKTISTRWRRLITSEHLQRRAFRDSLREDCWDLDQKCTSDLLQRIHEEVGPDAACALISDGVEPRHGAAGAKLLEDVAAELLRLGVNSTTTSKTINQMLQNSVRILALVTPGSKPQVPISILEKMSQITQDPNEKARLLLDRAERLSNENEKKTCNPSIALAFDEAAEAFNKLDEKLACSLRQSALEIWKTALGENHPYILAYARELSVYLFRSGDQVSAMKLINKVLADQELHFGLKHPCILGTQSLISEMDGFLKEEHSDFSEFKIRSESLDEDGLLTAKGKKDLVTRIRTESEDDYSISASRKRTGSEETYNATMPKRSTPTRVVMTPITPLMSDSLNSMSLFDKALDTTNHNNHANDDDADDDDNDGMDVEEESPEGAPFAPAVPSYALPEPTMIVSKINGPLRTKSKRALGEPIVKPTSLGGSASSKGLFLPP